MTREQFDVWLEAPPSGRKYARYARNYDALVAIARKFTAEPEDAVQTAVARWLTSSHYLKCDATRNPLAWFARGVTSAAFNARTSAARTRANRRELASAAGISGRKRPAPRAD